MMATRGACTEQGHLNKNLVVVVRATKGGRLQL